MFLLPTALYVMKWASGFASRCILKDAIFSTTRSCGGLGGSTRRLQVDLPLGDGGELLVGGLFLVERGGQELGDRTFTEFLGPGDQAAVPGNLVMLHCLRRRNQGGIEHVLVVDLSGDLVGLVDNAVDRRALGALRALADQFERLLKPLHLLLGFLKVA